MADEYSDGIILQSNPVVNGHNHDSDVDADANISHVES